MKSLIIVDVQNDFCPGGNLPVAEGDEVISVINRIRKQEKFDLIIASQDWHPANHLSFASNHPGKALGDVIQLNGLEQVLWPDHCVQGTKGAKFSSRLYMEKTDCIFQKGTDKQIDSYSAFYDNGHLKSTGLGEYLKQQRVDEVHIAGLATDYCVKYTALDALKMGFCTYLILEGCRGVNLKHGDVDRSIAEMKREGIHIV